MLPLAEKWFSGESVSDSYDLLTFPIRDKLEETKCK